MVVLVVGACLCGDSKKPRQLESAQQPTTRSRAFASRIAGVKGAENLAMINPGLYRGAQPEADGYRSLAEMGIRTVVNLREFTCKREEVESAGMNYVRIPLRAGVFGSEPPDEEQLKLFFDTVLDPRNQPVFFHCLHGKDRTGTMAALYRIEIDGWTAEEAIEEMRHFGYHEIYRDLIGFVRSYTPRGFRARP